MIAIVILGLGLLVAAAMFPIAWSRARDLAEHTTADSCVAAAETAVKLTCRVDSAKDCVNYTSFAGDYVAETTFAYRDSFSISNDVEVQARKVHPLTLENILVTPPSSGASPIITEDAWLLADPNGTAASGDDVYILQNRNVDTVCPQPAWLNDSTGNPLSWYARPQILFQERVFPSVPPWPDPTGTPAATPEDIDRWNTLVDTRGYGWAVFHRLNDIIAHPPMSAPPTAAELAARKKTAGRARTFTMYYVTLKRGAGQRFARQDEGALVSGNIKALPHTTAAPTDVKFPSPWLIGFDVSGTGGIITPDPYGSPRELNYRDPPDRAIELGVAVTDPAVADQVPRGVPTEVTVELPPGVPAGGNATCEDFRDFFPVGAQFIDERSGELFRVTKRRLDDGSDPKRAILTLDRELFMEDIEDPIPPPPHNRNRRVWVFPPAVEARTTPGDPLLIEGRSPIVEVAVRSLAIHPQ